MHPSWRFLGRILLALLLWSACVLVEARDSQGRIILGGPLAPDGKTEVTCDLPVEQRIKNIGSRADGAGMCVMSSCEMSARWANLEVLRGLRDWCARQPGGAYPAKVDRQFKEFCAAKGIALQPYLQYEGKDPALLREALRTGRMPCVTYNGHDPHYAGSIAHMVNLIHLDEHWAVILDNNFTGQNELVWLTPDDFRRRWLGNGGGWAVILLAPPPPPVPHN